MPQGSPRRSGRAPAPEDGLAGHRGRQGQAGAGRHGGARRDSPRPGGCWPPARAEMRPEGTPAPRPAQRAASGPRRAGAHAPALRRHWRRCAAPRGRRGLPRRQRAAPRSTWRRGHLVRRRWAARAGHAGARPSRLRRRGRPVPRRKARRAVTGSRRPGGWWAPCVLDAGSARS